MKLSIFNLYLLKYVSFTNIVLLAIGGMSFAALLEQGYLGTVPEWMISVVSIMFLVSIAANILFVVCIFGGYLFEECKNWKKERREKENET